MTQPNTAENLIRLNGMTPLKICGEGAFGTVWLAEDAVGRKVAVKIIDKAALGSSWEREFNGLQKYCRNIGTHPNLITIFHISDAETCFCYTMEAADNIAAASGDYLSDTLEARLGKNGRFQKKEIAAMTLQLLSGLKAIHAAGLIHRDIKPGNILFAGGTVKIGDIGLVASSHSLVSIAGTPDFMPPESFKPETAGTYGCTQDLYSLGKVVYCMFSGYPPDAYPSLPPELYRDYSLRSLNDFLNKACSPDRTQRFQDAETFEEAFSRAILSPGFLHYPKRVVTIILLLLGGVILLSAAIPAFRHSTGKNVTAAKNVRGNVPLSSSPFAKLIFFDRLAKSPAPDWKILPEPRELFSWEPDGIRMLTPSPDCEDSRRTLFLELPQIPLNSDFEILFITEGNIKPCILRFYLYPHSIFPKGIIQDKWKNYDYFSLENLIYPDRIVFSSAQWGEEILRVGMGNEISGRERSFRWTHRFLRENGKLSYYANGQLIFEMPLSEIWGEEKGVENLRFALNIAADHPGIFIIRNVAIYVSE